MLCDGRMVCGCADPYAKRVLGDARTTSIADIWHGPGRLAAARRPQPGRLELLRRLPAEAAARPTTRRRRSATSTSAPIPGRLYIECTAACNISCFQACCAPETGITRTRQAGMLDFDLFTKVIDEAGPSLGRIDFFNYGEAFLHKRAVEMCEYIKTKFPHIYLYTSTNGLAFTEEKVAPAGALGHRRGHVLDRRRVAGDLRASIASAATSTRRSPTCARCSTSAPRPAATCRS